MTQALPAVVVLHGANGCAAELEPLAAPLRAYGRVLVHNLPGHGGRAVPDRLGIGMMAEDVVALLDREGIERAFFVGYSLGGYTALHLARHFPARTLGACAVATKFIFDRDTVSRGSYLAKPERLARPGNHRGEEMLRAHGEGWRAVTEANAALFEEIGRSPTLTNSELAAIERPVMLVNANRDPLVSWAETLAVGKLVPNARLVMCYGIAHPLRHVQVDSVGRAIGQWMAQVQPP